MVSTKEERFLELYWKYQELVKQIVGRRIHDYDYAQDICQETFMKLFRSKDLSLRDEEIKAWLIVVADNAAKDVLKKGGKYRQVSVEEVGGEEIRFPQALGEDGFEEIERKELRFRILDHLRKVNAEQYKIVVLVCCLQLSIGDAARRLHMTYEQASMRLYRARNWIRANYREEYLEIKY